MIEQVPEINETIPNHCPTVIFWDGMGWDGMGTFVHLYQVLSFFYSNNPVGHYADADKSYIKKVHKTNRMSYI
jgi:hypothetical protein